MFTISKILFFLKISFFLSLLSISYQEDCQLNVSCSECISCGGLSKDFSTCNYGHVFCLGASNINTYKDTLITLYSNYFRGLPGVDKLCGNSDFEITKKTKNKNVINTKNFDDFFKSNNKIHCNYYVINDYYLDSSDNNVTISFYLKKKDKNKNKSIKENDGLKFNVYVIVSSLNSGQLISFNDTELRENDGFSKENIGSFFSFDILIDVENNFSGTEQKIDEYLEIKITNGGYKKFLIIVIITGVCIGLILFLIIFCYCRFRIKYRNRLMNQRRRAYLTAHGDDNNGEGEISEEEIKKKNEEKIKTLMNGVLKEKTFSKAIDEKDCSRCTICLEDFKEGSTQIRVTPCKHIFHVNCFDEYIFKNLMLPFCPNCKYDIASYDPSKEIIPKVITIGGKDSEDSTSKIRSNVISNGEES